MRNVLVLLTFLPAGLAHSQIRFEDVTEQAGILDAGINGAGVAFWDYDQDGDVDVYITNSDSGTAHLGLHNRLWENDGTGVFMTSPKTAASQTWAGWAEAYRGVITTMTVTQIFSWVTCPAPVVVTIPCPPPCIRVYSARPANLILKMSPGKQV